MPRNCVECSIERCDQKTIEILRINDSALTTEGVKRRFFHPETVEKEEKYAEVIDLGCVLETAYVNQLADN